MGIMKKIHGRWKSNRIKNDSLKRLIIIIVKTGFNEVFISIVLVIILIILLKLLGHRSSSELFSELIDLSVFSTAIIAAIITMLSSAIKKHLYNYVEDNIKLLSDYSELIQIYKCEQLEDVGDINDRSGVLTREEYSETVIPIVSCAELDDNISIVIEDDSKFIYQLPDLVKQHFIDLLSSHKTSNVFNNLNVRVNDWKLLDNRFVIKTGRTHYLSSMVTNRAMDYDLGSGLTIRKAFSSGNKLTPLCDSNLSNHLGFNGMVVSSDGMCPLVYRGDDVSIGKRTYGNSVGASLKTKYALEEGLFTLEGLIKAIKYEIKDELAIELDDIGDIHFLNAYRELVEGGKPQLFFFVEINREYIEIDKRFKETLTTDNSSMLRDGKDLVWVSCDDIRDNMAFFADYITADIWQCNKGKSKKQRTSISMLPSASGCMLFFHKFLVKQSEQKKVGINEND